MLILRLVSVLGVILALSMLSIWLAKPEWVREYDAEAQESYLSEFNDPVDAAIVTLNKDPQVGVIELELALDQFPKLHAQDHLFVPLQSALKLLATAHLKLGNVDKAQGFAERVYRAEENHLGGQLLWINCLLAKPATRDQGRTELEGLARLFPGQRVIARKNVELLQREGEQEAAALAAVRYLASPLVNGQANPDVEGNWYGWWSSDRAFYGEKRKLLSPNLTGTKLRMQFDVPAGQTSVRVDLPARIGLRMKLLSVNGKLADRAVQIPHGEDVRRDNDLVWKGAELRANSHPDAWFALELPTELQSEPFKFRLVAGLSASAEWVSEALDSRVATEEAFRLSAEGRDRIADEIARIQFGSWVDRGLLFEGLAKPIPAGAVPLPQGRTPFATTLHPDGRRGFGFNVTVPPEGGVLTLRPDPCFQWELLDLDVERDGDLLEYSVVQTGMARGEDGSWRAVSSDPSFALHFKASGDGAAASLVTIRGAIR